MSVADRHALRRCCALEVLHEIHQRLDAFDGHGVVDGRAHAAHRTMSFEIHEADLGRLGAERLVEIRLGERERHVHPGTRIRRHRALVEAAAFDEAVELFGLGAVALFHRLQAALLLEPLEHEAREVPAEGRRRVEHGAFVGHGLEVPHGRRAGARLADEVVAHDHDADARRADVLLRAGVDEAELRHVDGARQDGGAESPPPAARCRLGERSRTPRRRWFRWACSGNTRHSA